MCVCGCCWTGAKCSHVLVMLCVGACAVAVAMTIVVMIGGMKEEERVKVKAGRR